MKTITIDFDTYTKELEDARSEGERIGYLESAKRIADFTEQMKPLVDEIIEITAVEVVRNPNSSPRRQFICTIEKPALYQDHLRKLAIKCKLFEAGQYD